MPLMNIEPSYSLDSPIMGYFCEVVAESAYFLFFNPVDSGLYRQDKFTGLTAGVDTI